MAAPALLVLLLLAACRAQIFEDEIDAARLKRETSADDVTTVLLVDNQKLSRDSAARNGRYLNVKPVIGLLTSTARTFIQDGVTTEYATEILGTTLDNGRVYAQLLTKSSLVLYDRPHDHPRRTDFNRELFRGAWTLDDSLRDQYVVKNTDYVSPREGEFQPSRPIQESFSTAWVPLPALDVQMEDALQVERDDAPRVQGLGEIPRYSEFEAFNFLDPLPAARERKISSYSEVKDAREEKALARKPELKNKVADVPLAIEPAKVNPSIKLPTFTVKNEFSPIFYYIDNVESKTERSNRIQNFLKNPKKLFGQKEEQKPMKTFTYYGFANFTTLVGDTVIVFSPSTANGFVKENQEEVTPSAKPEIQPNVATKLKTFLSSDSNMLTETMFGHHINMETALPTFVMKPQDLGRASKALINQEDSLKNVLYEKPMEDEEQVLKNQDKFNRVIASLKSGLFVKQQTQFGLNRDAVQPSETSYSTIQRTHATDLLEGVRKTVLDSRPSNILATEPLGFVRSSTTSLDDVEESITTEKITTEAAEITTETEERTQPTTEEAPTTQQTERPAEEDQPEDEDMLDVKVSEDATCTGGVIPVSTMTTAFKTLTYLTTYFIPLKGTETTTSVKSEVVVTSEVGFTTDLACKTEEVINIKPTASSDLKIKPSRTAAVEIDNRNIEEVTEAEPPTLTTTETPTEKPEETTTETTTTESPPEVTTENAETTTRPEERIHETTESEDSRTTVELPGTERAITTVEMSITTEESIGNRFSAETTTEKQEGTTESDDEDELDIIYKTLYTTYTYFTTYFQGATSTVASKKSVVTNVITSTLDISEIDPSLFNAIESSDYLFKATQREELGEITPTSVGVGRPTRTFARYENSIVDLVRNRQVIDSAENEAILSSRISTPELNAETLFEDIRSDVVKTFYTTYTFFTTLYVEGDVNVCSRSEIYTNYVGPASLIPSKSNEVGPMKTKSNEIDFSNCKVVPADKINALELPEVKKPSEGKLKQNVYTSIDRTAKKTYKPDDEDQSRDDLGDLDLKSGESMQVTDIKSSYSKGDRQIIDNAVLDDQISSESNIDEIMPSPTLLLQTSFTTFTYFTTMYIGKDASKVKSRLETVTNVVTETLDPKNIAEETNLPITYYTTFTYWTTLYKDKTTTITSRENIISNVVTPSLGTSTATPVETDPIEVSTIQIRASGDNAEEEKQVKPSAVDDLLADDGKATFFTTYTYFTTFYVGNTSELRSSLETITNIVDNTLVNENQLGRAVGKQPASGNLLDNGGERPVIESTALPDGIVPTKIVGDNVILSTQLSGSLSEEGERRIISSQVAVISGESTVISNAIGQSEDAIAATKVDGGATDSKETVTGPTLLEGSVTDPTDLQEEEEGEEGDEDEDEDDEDGNNSRKKSRLTFQTRKRTFTPVIRPFASRNRPTFSPKRVSLTSATTITRTDFTPTITATPALKSTKSSGFGGGRKPASAFPGGNSGGRRFTRISAGASSSTNSPAQRTAGFGRGRPSATEVQPPRRGGFRTSSARINPVDLSTRPASARVRPTAASRYRGSKQTATTSDDDLSTFVTEDPTAADDESSTQAETGEPGRRTTNSLLRFRRPPFTRGPVVTTPRAATTTTRRGSFNRNRAAATVTTPKPTPRTTINPLFNLRNRQRPNALFPPRGLINRQPEPTPEEEVDEDQVVDNEEGDEENEEEGLGTDSDYESSDRRESQVASTTTTLAPRRISNTPVIKPFGFRRRTKRQATDYGARRTYSNFRRPGARTPKPEPKVEVEPEVEVTSPPKTRTQGRYLSRNSNNTPKPARVTATVKTPNNGRQPFILRGESKTSSATTPRSSFRSRSSRPSSRSSTSTVANLRPKAPRLKTFASPQTESSRTSARTSARSRTSTGSSRPRTSIRYRTTANDIADNNYNYQPPNDGKLTITHKIPMEVTIPVVNGKLTEYKNVLTASPSTEVLLPNQYSTTQNAFGSQYIVLVSESSEAADNGATKVIQFILHETPTTSIVFTPTTIRGRRTSFSHIIPSTVYDVERVTSTLRAQISPDVPLANILLSQLLLGNIAMPQPQLNPLLALQAPQQAAPTTEFRIRTTTYVTTVTDAKSTVLPITFRGKEILTTIVDSRVDVITATEFITDTVVVTPTAVIPGRSPDQLNSILLLLQQQQAQVQQHQQSELLGPRPEVLNVKEEDFLTEEPKALSPPPPPPRRKNKPAPPRESSVITLYVSGRTPGEFSTVLSTVYQDEAGSVHKREAVYDSLATLETLQHPSEVLGSLEDLLPPLAHNSLAPSETQSLESILGKVELMTLERPEEATPRLLYVRTAR